MPIEFSIKDEESIYSMFVKQLALKQKNLANQRTLSFRFRFILTFIIPFFFGISCTQIKGFLDGQVASVGLQGWSRVTDQETLSLLFDTQQAVFALSHDHRLIVYPKNDSDLPFEDGRPLPKNDYAAFWVEAIPLDLTLPSVYESTEPKEPSSSTSVESQTKQEQKTEIASQDIEIEDQEKTETVQSEEQELEIGFDDIEATQIQKKSKSQKTSSAQACISLYCLCWQL